MLLSVIIPTYNEKNTLERIVKKVLDVPVEKEIIIIDDGSTDGSGEILKNISHDSIHIYYHENNRGKGSAIRTGLSHVRGDVVVIQDADLEYNPQEYLVLLEAMRSFDVPVVYGSRFLHAGYRYSSLRFYIGGLILSFLTTVLYGKLITDEPTCYKMFKADVIKKIPLVCTGFEFCPEITAKILKRRIPIKEVAITYNARSIADGKKIAWRDAFVAVWTLMRFRFCD